MENTKINKKDIFNYENSTFNDFKKQIHYLISKYGNETGFISKGLLITGLGLKIINYKRSLSAKKVKDNLLKLNYLIFTMEIIQNNLLKEMLEITDDRSRIYAIEKVLFQQYNKAYDQEDTGIENEIDKPNIIINLTKTGKLK